MPDSSSCPSRDDTAASAPLRLYVCGRLAIEHAGAVVRERDFPARQGRRLWAFLVINRRRPLGRDELVDALWGQDLPDSWDSTLNGLVSRLRRLLRGIPIAGDELGIHGEVGRYVLRVPPGTFVDHERARHAIHQTEILLRQRAYGESLAEARVALEIATRGFLAGEDAPWIIGQRRLLADIELRALEYTVAGELARGNPGTAEREARELVRLDPLRESGYRLLMQALAAQGNRAEVPPVLAHCRRALREQAALDPSAETERLYQELMRGAQDGEW